MNIYMTYQVVRFIRCVVTELTCLFTSGLLDEVAELIHEVPANVVPVLALGEGEVTNGTSRTDVDLFWLVHNNLTFLSDKIFILATKTNG